jgi:hypothetical protein
MNPIKKYSLKTLDDLIIDTSGEKYAVKKNEEEGIKDLRKLVASSKLEGAWAYIPKKELWIWTVEKLIPERRIKTEKEFSSARGVELDIPFLLELGFKIDVEVYHIHLASPLLAVKDFAEYVKKRYSIDKEIFKLFREKIYLARSLNAVAPSGFDLEVMVDLSMRFYFARSKGKTSHKLCSQYGVTEYCLNEEGKRFFDYRKTIHLNGKELERDKIQGEILKKEIEKIEKETEEKIFSLDLWGKQPTEDTFQEIIEQVGNKYTTITFTPYTE